MKFLSSLTAVVGVAAVAFLSVAQPAEAKNAITSSTLGHVRVMEAQVHSLKDAFTNYLAGDCAQTAVAYHGMADLITSIETTMAEIKASGRPLAGSDVAKIGQVLSLTADTIHEIIDSLIYNQQRLVDTGAVWIVQKGLPIFQQEYEAFKAVLLVAVDLKRRASIQDPITRIIQEITRGVVAFQQDTCSCYNPDTGAEVANYGIGIQILIDVAISVTVSVGRRDLPGAPLALPSL